MRALLITVGSLMLTAGVLTNAYIHKRQFYPSVVYITKSSPSMAVLYVQALVFVVLLGKVMRQIFFSQLRSAELEHLIERSWYAVTETCLAFTVFRDDFSPRFVALFTILLFLKCFHWLAEDRIDYMERSPVITWLFHIRAVSLLALLGFLDAFFVSHAYSNTLIKGPSVQLVFGFEYAILMTVVIHIFVKYVLHTVDVQSENPWENKAVYLLYAELALGLVKCFFYVTFLAIMIKVHTFPLFVIRPMYLTIREFKKALHDVVMSRRAIRNMNTLYPDASAEDLASGDNVCIICREEMHTSCKKLPCNHIFHTSCLRSWFQRQQTCPTCRMDVLRQIPAGTAAPREQQVQQQQHQQQQPGAQQVQPPPVNPVPPIFPGFMGGMHPGAGMFPPWIPAAAPQQQAGAASAAATTTAPNMPTVPGVSPGPFPMWSPPPMFPSFTMAPPPLILPPFAIPTLPQGGAFGGAFGSLPPPPPGTLGLSDEELRMMEGEERRNVEARIRCLQDINVLLTAALTQMQQYTTLTGGMFGHESQGLYSGGLGSGLSGGSSCAGSNGAGIGSSSLGSSSSGAGLGSSSVGSSSVSCVPQSKIKPEPAQPSTLTADNTTVQIKSSTDLGAIPKNSRPKTENRDAVDEDNPAVNGREEVKKTSAQLNSSLDGLRHRQPPDEK